MHIYVNIHILAPSIYSLSKQTASPLQPNMYTRILFHFLYKVNKPKLHDNMLVLKIERGQTYTYTNLNETNISI